MYPKADEQDESILQARMRSLNDRPGIRVGDWLRRPDGEMTRATHIWRFDDRIHSVQDGGTKFGRFYLADGHCSYSGGLDPGVPPIKIFPTSEIADGMVWFFHHDYMTAHNGVEFVVPFRVFEIRDDAQGNPYMCPRCHNINAIVNQCGCDPDNLPTRAVGKGVDV